MRIFIFGKNGMLGRYVYLYLKECTEYEIIGLTRKEIDLVKVENFSLLNDKFTSEDVVINCVGIIPQRHHTNDLEFITINTMFPQYINSLCKKIGTKFINITSDCVFNGKIGKYAETSTHDAISIYGRTKSLGEPKEATTIRTSIIGEQLNSCCSLLEWVKYNKDGEVKGYANHFWNGITCLMFAKICEYIIKNEYYWEGVRHITSPEILSKYKLVKLISDIYKLNVKVESYYAENFCDRSLYSIKDPFPLEIPSLEEQIKEQRKFMKELVKYKD